MPGSGAPGTGKPTAAGGIVWGALSGFTSTIIQAGAPPFQVFVLPQRLPKMTLVGTMTIFFALVNIMKVAPYLALGQFSPATLATSAILLPIAVAANFDGIWLVRVTSLETFYRLPTGWCWSSRPYWPGRAQRTSCAADRAGCRRGAPASQAGSLQSGPILI